MYSLANGWAYIRGDLKPGGALKCDFTVYRFVGLRHENQRYVPLSKIPLKMNSNLKQVLSF